MRISDWSSDVCSSDLLNAGVATAHALGLPVAMHASSAEGMRRAVLAGADSIEHGYGGTAAVFAAMRQHDVAYLPTLQAVASIAEYFHGWKPGDPPTAEMQQAAQAFRLRSEEHTSELQSLMRISYAVFCLK